MSKDMFLSASVMLIFNLDLSITATFWPRMKRLVPFAPALLLSLNLFSSVVGCLNIFAPSYLGDLEAYNVLIENACGKICHFSSLRSTP